MSIGRRFIALMAVVAIGVSSFSITTNAQEQGGSGLSISPTRTDLVIDPGKSDEVNLSLRNVSGQDVTAKVIVNDFESDGITGEPKIIIEDKGDTGHSIKSFVKDIGDIELKKDEKKDFTIKIEVPSNAAPGAYYGVIRYTAVPLGQELPQNNEVALTASVGSLVLVEVPGDIKEQIQVRSVKVLSSDRASSFFMTAPDKVAIEIKNNGNGFARPFGRVAIANSRGKEVHSYELNNSEPKANVLPSSVRIFKNDLKNVKSPGRYTLTGNISHGLGGEVITFKSSFWYVPVWLIILIVALVVVTAAGGYWLYRKKFGRKRR